MLRLSEEMAQRHPNPVAFAGYAQALALNGRPTEAVAPLELALRLSPRDALRAEWQYRLALAHFMLNHMSKRAIGVTRANQNPDCRATNPGRRAGAFGEQRRGEGRA